MNKAFKRRYFVLNGRMLAYYSNVHSRAANGTLDVSQVVKLHRHVVAATPSAVVAGHAAVEELELHTPSRVWHLRAFTHVEAEMWERVLRPFVQPEQLTTFD